MTFNSGDILFEKFKIIDCLKKDSHTSVYLADHIYLGKKIILKTLNTDELKDTTILERFKREAKILAQLDHPNLIKVLDFGTHLNHFYISFEYFKSRNLREVIKQNNLTKDDKKSIFIQLLKALNIAHQNNIIHRDIKPENILLGAGHQLKIADFGLALIQDETSLTQGSSIVGTPGYMSPEQLRGEKSFQSDIFSAGLVAYELYTGANPFSSETISETINNILNYNENSGDFDLNSLPEDIRPAISSMLKKKPKERVKTVLEALNLLGIEGDVYKPVEPAAFPDKKKYTFVYGIVASLIIIIIGGLLFSNGLIGNFEKNNLFNQQSGQTNMKSMDSLGNIDSSINFYNSLNKDSLSDKTVSRRKEKNADVSEGKLFVECTPWADIYIDDKKLDSTPLKDYIHLRTGKHSLKLVNPSYPPYKRIVNITSDKITSLTIDFKELIGYLNCNVNPWGEVYVNSDSIGITPFRSPIKLYAGNYKLIIKNKYIGILTDEIHITAKDTLNYNLNFETSKKVKKIKAQTELLNK